MTDQKKKEKLYNKLMSIFTLVKQAEKLHKLGNDLDNSFDFAIMIINPKREIVDFAAALVFDDRPLNLKFCEDCEAYEMHDAAGFCEWCIQ